MSPHTPSILRAGITSAFLVLFLLPDLASASDPPAGWIKVKRGEVAVETPPPDGRSRHVALEMGYPGVFAPRFHFPVSRRQTAGIGPTLLPGLIGLTGEYRYHLIPPARERFSLHGGGGFVFYDIGSDGRSSSTAGIFLSLGTLYTTRSRFLLGGSLGLLNTTGDDEEDPVETFGLRKGLSAAYVNFSIGYVF